MKISKKVSPKLKNKNFEDLFEVIELNVVEEKDFQFRVHALCDCLGFRKWAINSKIFILDPAGNKVKTDTEIEDSLQTKLIKGKFQSSGIYKMIVVADSEYTGKKLSDIEGNIDGVSLSLPLVSHPEGNIQIKWK